MTTARAWESSIDWITTTYNAEEEGYIDWLHHALNWREGTRDKDSSEKVYAMNGFDGSIYNSVAIGVSQTHGLVRGSGAIAHSVFLECYDPRANVSRIDPCLTVWFDTDNSKTIREEYFKSEAAWEASNGRLPKPSLIASPQNGDTLYVGSRTSEVMLRFYNKKAQSGEEAYSNALRYECEIKGDKASQLAKTLYRIINSGEGGEQRAKEYIRDLVLSLYRERGIAIPFDPAGEVEQLSTQRRRADDEKTIAWLKKQVRPAIRKLIAKGKWQEVMEALGIAELEE